MRITLVANLSANGQVLLAENPSHVAPQEALVFFAQQANTKGNIIIGRKTFEVMQMFPGGIKVLFPTAEIVILSNSTANIEGFTVKKSPEEAIEYLKSKSFQDILVGGGTAVFNAFLSNDLVSEIYFNNIPLLISDGGIIGNTGNLNATFKLGSYQILTPEIGQMHLVKK